MLDIKWIRENRNEFEQLLKKRNVSIDVDKLLSLDQERRGSIQLQQNFENARNTKSHQLSDTRKRISVCADEIKRDVQDISFKLEDIKKKIKEICFNLNKILGCIPNILLNDVPHGLDSTCDLLVKKYKEINLGDTKIDHLDFALDLDLIDIKKTTEFSGSGFVTLKHELAALNRALINFMIDTHKSEFQFEELFTPTLVLPNAMYNAGQLPKFEQDSYDILIKKTDDLSDNQDSLNELKRYKLIPTAEVTLINTVANSILPEEELPLRYVGYSECYRVETGGGGKKVRGLMRNHQFGKVELVSICPPSMSSKEHEYLLNAAEVILKKLDIPYRVMLLCSGETGFTSAKTYDIEVWLPSHNRYVEISSVSNCLDFQARRMSTKYKKTANDKKEFVHTMNGSGLAIGRTIMAILENYQDSDTSFVVPNILRPYMNGIERIKKHEK